MDMNINNPLCGCIYGILPLSQWAKSPKNSLKECVLLILHSKYTASYCQKCTPTDCFFGNFAHPLRKTFNRHGSISNLATFFTKYEVQGDGKICPTFSESPTWLKSFRWEASSPGPGKSYLA